MSIHDKVLEILQNTHYDSMATLNLSSIADQISRTILEDIHPPGGSAYRQPFQMEQDVLRTEPTSEKYIEAAKRLHPFDADTLVPMRLLHAAMGICTEGGELMDVVKKYVFYGKPIDWVNVSEEVGDLFWYQFILINTMRTLAGHRPESFEAIMGRMIDKLRKRYPEKFTEQGALVRDLDAERRILEGNAAGAVGADPSTSAGT